MVTSGAAPFLRGGFFCPVPYMEDRGGAERWAEPTPSSTRLSFSSGRENDGAVALSLHPLPPRVWLFFLPPLPCMLSSLGRNRFCTVVWAELHDFSLEIPTVLQIH